MASSLVIALFLLLLQQYNQVLAIVSSNVHIVYMGNKSHDQPQLAVDSYHQILSNIIGSKEAAMESILYSYKHGFSGFAALLTPSQAKILADIPGVVCVVPNRILSSHTTRSWDFLNINSNPGNGILSKAQSGVGSIIGVLDTGIWPESKSFRDAGMGKVPSRWKGTCQEGEEFNHLNCNRKIIGARWYVKGYEAEFGKLNPGVEFLSARDASGHGTHTSSIAAGALIENASYAGLARGTARGGAPSAWLAIYKVCWSTGSCSTADILAAFDDAIFDGVDVISVSLGSSPPLPTYVEDVLAIGSFHAVAKGITVVCSAGNSGPYAETVANTAPWMISVAASTIDRAFPTLITLGNNRSIVGQALYTGNDVDKFHPIVFGGDIASVDSDGDTSRSCEAGSLNATLARGKVVLCFQSQFQRSAATAARAVLKASGVGLVFAQSHTRDVALSPGIPCVEVDIAIGTYLLTYIKTRNPIVRFSHSKTVTGRQISPEVAFFSSRGPSSLSPTVLKPDIAAPGVNILASWSRAASFLPIDISRNENNPLDFKIESGTSMSCPHITGIVALLKAVHPTWSPAAIKSALVTTASVEDTYGESAVAEGAPPKQADPFDYGGGHVDANKATDPGLVFDMKNKDHVNFLCSMGYNNTAIRSMTGTRRPCMKTKKFLLNLNLPSISIPELKNCSTVSRTVTNVGPAESLYTARVQSPPHINVTVEPSVLSFGFATRKVKFKVRVCSMLRVHGRYSFGNLLWEDGVHVVRIPLVVRSVIEDFYY